MDAGRVIAQQDKAEFEWLGVGDRVVYGAHGIGRVVARAQNQVGGTECDCVVVDFAVGLYAPSPSTPTSASAQGHPRAIF